jgi:hypothetical protein
MSETLDHLLAHQPTRWRSFTTEQEFLRCCGKDWGSFKKKRKPDEEAYPEWARHVADEIDLNAPRSAEALPALAEAIEHIDPDCKNDKHPACPGWTFADDLDRTTPCECACHDPEEHQP